MLSQSVYLPVGEFEPGTNTRTWKQSAFRSLKAVLMCANLTFAFVVTPASAVEKLSLSKAIDIALESDVEFQRLELVEMSAREQSIVASELPDPVIKLGLLNLPSDTLDFDQEPMTQLRVGVMQQFPAGDSRRIRSEQISLKGKTTVPLKENRQLQIARDVKNLWLQVEYWQQAHAVFAEDQSLFSQLIEVTQSLYGVGRVNQQDVLRAELELARLQDRLLNAGLKEKEIRAELTRWLGGHYRDAELIPSGAVWILPKTVQLERRLLSHPQIRRLDLEIEVAGKEHELLQQEYKPKWGLEVGYGWRDGENPDGSARADFLSAGVNVQLPLFTSNRQDRKSSAVKHQQEALRFQRQDLLRSLRAKVEVELERERQHRERALLYQQEIIPKANDQTQASLNSYQADTGTFSDVVLAALQVQRLRLEWLKIQMQQRQALARLQYLLPGEQRETGK